MDKYIEQLIDDIKQARQKVQPPHPLWLDSEADPYDEGELEDLSYVEQFVYGKEVPVSEITGIDAKLLPPTERLSPNQRALLAEELEALLHHYHLHPEFPNLYPSYLKYPFLLKVWSQSHVPLSYGENHIEFCDYNVENCPFEGYCHVCGDMEMEKRLARNSAKDDLSSMPFELIAPASLETNEDSNNPIDYESIKKLLEHLSEQTKSNFLYRLTEIYPSIANLLIETFKDDYQMAQSITSNNFEFEDYVFYVEDNADNLRDELDSIDLEDIDYNSDAYRDYYVSESDLGCEEAEGVLYDILSPTLSELKKALETNELRDIFAEVIILYKAGIEAHPNDPNDFLPPLEDHISYEIKHLVDAAQKQSPKKEYTLDDFTQASKLVFTFHAQLQNDNFLVFTCQLLENYITNKEFAQKFLGIGKQMNTPLYKALRVVSKALKLIDDKDAWLQNLELGFTKELGTSLELMDYYYTNAPEKFEDAAERLLTAFGLQVYDYLMPKVKQGSPIHIEILKGKIWRQNDSSCIQPLLGFCTQDEVNAFIASLNNNYMKAIIYAQMGNFQEIVSLIQQYALHNNTLFEQLDFIKAIELVYKELPNEAIELTITRIDNLFNAERKRETYALIARTIACIPPNIPGYERLRQLTLDLYNHEPKLPALKDEFRKAGLIKP